MDIPVHNQNIVIIYIMSPPLTKEHLQILNKEFYDNLNFFRDRQTV